MQATIKSGDYAGATCPNCHRGINNEIQINSEIARSLQRRFGRRLCNTCVEAY